MKKWVLDNMLHFITLLLILGMGMKINILQEKLEKVMEEKAEMQEIYQREINETINTYQHVLKGEE